MTRERVILTERLIDGLYTEAMLLADEARAYFDSVSREDRNVMSPLARVTFSCESLKVTTRLMHVVAWLLARRSGSAIVTALSAASDSAPAEVATLPEEAQQIIRSSIDLYDRVVRLEQRLADTATDSPVLNMQHRLRQAF